MTEILDPDRMRVIERAAIKAGAATASGLMERAGEAVCEAILDRWPEFRDSPRRVMVLCGPGNNGGDGFVVARILRNLGWDVGVFHFGSRERLSEEARSKHDLWLRLGPVSPLAVEELERFGNCQAIVEAVFGIGALRDMSGALGDVMEHLASREARKIAIDCPFGLDLDTGEFMRAATSSGAPAPLPKFDLTVTFDSPKAGHFLGAGPQVCGGLAVKDIGLREFREATGGGESPKAALVGRRQLVPDSRPETRLDVADGLRKDQAEFHKYDHGHVLVLSGGAGRGGAARLAARGALRVGAGAVTLGCPGDAMLESASRLDAVMLREIGGAGDLEGFLDGSRISAVCLGPGQGVTETTRELVLLALERRLPAVLDADALSVFEGDFEALREALHPNVILTPHLGELKRIFPEARDGGLGSGGGSSPGMGRIGMVRRFAGLAGCAALLKGHATIMCDSSATAWVHAASYARAAPGLATAGSGDVLAGFAAGLLARGFAPLEAARKAAWLHTECALEFGQGLISEDLPEQVGKVLERIAGPERGA